LVNFLNRIHGEKFSMRIDNCRNCGNELVVIELCNDCRQPLHFQCGNCSRFVDDPIHFHEAYDTALTRM